MRQCSQSSRAWARLLRSSRPASPLSKSWEADLVAEDCRIARLVSDNKVQLKFRTKDYRRPLLHLQIWASNEAHVREA